MDRNSVIGIIIITVLLLLYFKFMSPDTDKLNEQEGQEQVDSVTANTDTSSAPDSLITAVDSVSIPDSLKDVANLARYGKFAAGLSGEDKEVVLENEDIKIVLTSRGGKIKEVTLKDYVEYRDDLSAPAVPIRLFDEQRAKQTLILPGRGAEFDLFELYFESTAVKVDSAGQHISFTLKTGPNQYVEQTYTLPEEGFVLDYNIKFKGLDNELKNAPAKFSWSDNVKNTERDIEQTRTRTTVNYYTSAGDFDNLGERSVSEEEENIAEPLNWVAFKQNFFNTAIIAENQFTRGDLRSNANEEDTLTVKSLQAELSIPHKDLTDAKFKYYFGPNKYNVLKKVTDGFMRNVYLGYPVIKEINRFVVLPVFNFLERFISNYGLIITILVILIKILLFPLTYKSYISMAKMRVLKPEIDAIKERHGKNMQEVQKEQMQLYREMGVNPLSGCLPMLLQMPILFAMFLFFPNAIEIRQEGFLWANDLSTYDSVLSLPFTIPFYGNHVSLFTILMTASNLVYTYFNSKMTTGMQGPMKTLQFVMPVIFMFVLNSFAAGLTYYYFLSTLITIIQQLVIRRFVDEKKLRAKLEENKLRKKDKKKSGFRARMEEAMKAAESSKTGKKRR